MKVIVSGGRVAEPKVKRVSTRHRALMRPNYQQFIRDVADRIISDVKIMEEGEGKSRVTKLTWSGSHQLRVKVFGRPKRSLEEVEADLQLTQANALVALRTLTGARAVGPEDVSAAVEDSTEELQLERAIEDLSAQASELALLMSETVEETAEANRRIATKLDKTQIGFMENQKQLDRLEALMKAN